MKVNHKQDKAVLTNLSTALNISKIHIRKDELNYWNIIGKETFIDTDGEYWYIHIFSTSERKWKSCKESLEFMELINDGDDEGVLRMKNMPDFIQSKIIRKLLKLRLASNTKHFSSFQFQPVYEGGFK